MVRQDWILLSPGCAVRKTLEVAGLDHVLDDDPSDPTPVRRSVPKRAGTPSRSGQTYSSMRQGEVGKPTDTSPPCQAMSRQHVRASVPGRMQARRGRCRRRTTAPWRPATRPACRPADQSVRRSTRSCRRGRPLSGLRKRLMDPEGSDWCRASRCARDVAARDEVLDASSNLDAVEDCQRLGTMFTMSLYEWSRACAKRAGASGWAHVGQIMALSAWIITSSSYHDLTWRLAKLLWGVAASIRDDFRCAALCRIVLVIWRASSNVPLTRRRC